MFPGRRRSVQSDQKERRGPDAPRAAVGGERPRLPAPHQHLQGRASAAGAAEEGAVQRRAHGQTDDGERRVGEQAAAAGYGLTDGHTHSPTAVCFLFVTSSSL